MSGEIKKASDLSVDEVWRKRSEEIEKQLEEDPNFEKCEKHGKWFDKTEAFKCTDYDQEAIGVCHECWWEGFGKREGIREAKQDLDNRLYSLRLGPRFFGLSFDDYKCENKGQEYALTQARGIVERYDAFKEKGTQVLFYGKTGTGKTMLEAIIAQELVKAKHGVMVITVQQMIRSIRATFSTKESEQEEINKYAYVEFLMLDEVGVSLQSDYEKTVLFEILDERYKYKKPTLMTTNLSVADIEKYLEFRLMRRFRDSNGLMVPFEWEEYRGNR